MLFATYKSVADIISDKVWWYMISDKARYIKSYVATKSRSIYPDGKDP